VCNSLENTKILVNAGAVIDTIPYGNITILGSSLLSRKYDIIMYLLKIGINIDTPIYISYGQKVYADEYLRYIQYEPYKHEIPEINKVLKYIDEHKKVMRPTDTMVIKKLKGHLELIRCNAISHSSPFVTGMPRNGVCNAIFRRLFGLSVK
jgi:hypothetical protein